MSKCFGGKFIKNETQSREQSRLQMTSVAGSLFLFTLDMIRQPFLSLWEMMITSVVVLVFGMFGSRLSGKTI
jgi:hypothetical protein